MAVQAGSPERATAFPPIPLRRKLYGFGSIYGKTIRDSRLAFIIAAGLLGGMALVMGVAVSNIFPTPADQARGGRALREHPRVDDETCSATSTLIGAKVGTLGGYVTFKYGAIFALGTAIWSIMALSGTLAGEARRGSLDFVAAAPFGKRRIALEKLAAHLTLLWLAMVVLAVMTTFSSNVFGDAALGDQIPLLSVRRLRPLGRLPRDVLRRPRVRPLAAPRPCRLGRGRRPRDGRPVDHERPERRRSAARPEPVQLDVRPRPARRHLRLAVAGARGDPRRRPRGDRRRALRPPRPGRHGRPLAAPAAGGGPRRPRADGPGVRRPAPAGALVGDRPRPDRDPLRVARRGRWRTRSGASPSFQDAFAGALPRHADFASVGGWMQFYAELLYIAAGFAAATFVSRWASDETDGRLEMVLATPHGAGPVGRRRRRRGAPRDRRDDRPVRGRGRARLGRRAASPPAMRCSAVPRSACTRPRSSGSAWPSAACGGRRSRPRSPPSSSWSRTCSTSWRRRSSLPDWLHQLALTAHFGKPMVGEWDMVGVVACAGHRRRRDPARRMGDAAAGRGLMGEGGSRGADGEPSAPAPARASRARHGGPDGVARCAWGVEDDPLYRAYHDGEWGRPSRDERHLFEMLVLEGAQAGLSWSTILRKREGYRRAFAGFDPAVVAGVRRGRRRPPARRPRDRPQPPQGGERGRQRAGRPRAPRCR